MGVVTGGGGGGSGGGALTLISSATLAGSAANVDITGIAGVYNHLLLVFMARGDTAATEISALIRLNNDSGANYDGVDVFGNSAVGGSSTINAATSGRLGNATASTATAAAFATTSTLFPFYAKTTATKAFQTQGGRLGTVGTTTSYTVDEWQGEWRSTAAITRITLTPSAGNWVAGTAYTLHGML